MQCPLDGETLVMTHRSGVEIDYCPKCRGIWLDRGELDKIVDLAAADVGAARAPADDRRDDYRAPQRDHDDHRGRDYRDDHRDDHRGRRKRRESFLSDLFDFD